MRSWSDRSGALEQPVWPVGDDVWLEGFVPCKALALNFRV